MTQLEKMIISAYTGVLMVDQNDFHKFTEQLLKRPVQEYEFVTQAFWEILKQKTKKKFKELCKGE